MPCKRKRNPHGGFKKVKEGLSFESLKPRKIWLEQRGFETKITEQNIYGRTLPNGLFKRSMGGIAPSKREWHESQEKKKLFRLYARE